MIPPLSFYDSLMSPHHGTFLEEIEDQLFLPRNAGNVAYILEKERR